MGPRKLVFVLRLTEILKDTTLNIICEALKFMFLIVLSVFSISALLFPTVTTLYSRVRDDFGCRCLRGRVRSRYNGRGVIFSHGFVQSSL